MKIRKRDSPSTPASSLLCRKGGEEENWEQSTSSWLPGKSSSDTHLLSTYYAPDAGQWLQFGIWTQPTTSTIQLVRLYWQPVSREDVRSCTCPGFPFLASLPEILPSPVSRHQAVTFWCLLVWGLAPSCSSLRDLPIWECSGLVGQTTRLSHYTLVFHKHLCPALSSWRQNSFEACKCLSL